MNLKWMFWRAREQLWWDGKTTRKLGRSFNIWHSLCALTSLFIFKCKFMAFFSACSLCLHLMTSFYSMIKSKKEEASVRREWKLHVCLLTYFHKSKIKDVKCWKRLNTIRKHHIKMTVMCIYFILHHHKIKWQRKFAAFLFAAKVFDVWAEDCQIWINNCWGVSGY